MEGWRKRGGKDQKQWGRQRPRNGIKEPKMPRFEKNQIE